MARYEVYNDQYVGSPVKVVDTKTGDAVRQYDPWRINRDGALDLARCYCIALNDGDTP